jgi:hypothetical protein
MPGGTRPPWSIFVRVTQRNGVAVTRGLRVSATVTPNFFPLYHFFASHYQHFIPYFFISRSDSLYILSIYPTAIIKYHYPNLLIIYYHFFFAY